MRQGFRRGEPGFNPSLERDEYRQVNAVDSFVLRFGTGCPECLEFLLDTAVVSAEGSPLLFVEGKRPQELFVDIAEHIFREVAVIFTLDETVQRFLQVSVILRRTFAHEYPTVLEPFLPIKSVHDLVDHLGDGGVTVAAFLLLVVVMAEFFGDPVLLFGFPFLCHLEVFEPFPLQQFVLGRVFGRLAEEVFGLLIPLVIRSADADYF